MKRKQEDSNRKPYSPKINTQKDELSENKDIYMCQSLLKLQV